MHLLLPAHRGRAADHLLGDLRGPAALPRPDPLRRRQGPRRRRHTRRAGPLPGPAGRLPRPARPRGAGRGAARRASRATGSRPRSARRCTSWPCGTGWRCRCTRSTAPCRWSGTSRRCPRWPTSSTPLATTRPAGPRLRRHRLAAHPRGVPGQPVHRRRHRAQSGRCCASSPPCAPSSGPASSAWTWTRTCPPRSASTPDDLDDLYRLLAIAKYEQRYVIPPAHAEEAGRLMGQHEQLFCSLDTDGGPGMGGAGPARHPGLAPGRRTRPGPHVPRRRRPHPLQPARLGRPGRRAAPVPRTGRRHERDRRLQAGIGAVAVPDRRAVRRARRARRVRRDHLPQAGPGRLRAVPGLAAAPRPRPTSRSTTCRPSTCAAAARCT